MDRLWGMDPVFTANAKLFIRDVILLSTYPEFPGVYFLSGHPILAVHILGDVVSLCRRRQLITYEVDGGHDVIKCVQWREVEDSDQGLYIPHLGELVSVQGRVGEYRGERQVKISHITRECDPRVEPLHWLEVVCLKRTVYQETFSMPSTRGFPHLPIEDLRIAITESVIEYMRTLGRPVSLGELQTAEQLKSVCQKVGRQGGAYRGVDVDQELAKVLTSLPADHRLVPVGSCEPTTAYELLSDEKHLFPVILDYMQRKLKNEVTKELGVPEDWIVQFVTGLFGNVPPSRIAAAILKLIETSKIYSVTAMSYKCIT